VVQNRSRGTLAILGSGNDVCVDAVSGGHEQVVEQVVIALSGVDGSGKSTLAGALRDRVGASRCVVLGTRFDPRTALGQWGPRQPASNVRGDYKDSPIKRGMRRAGLRRTYTALASRLYDRQLALQLSAVSRYAVVVADRFVVDFIVDLRRSSHIELAAACRLVDELPSPTATVLVDAQDTVLRERAGAKKDDPELVVGRAALYRELAARLGIETVDTEALGLGDAVERVLGMVRLP
jgi:thymidylate kinase